jgi:hypothetical protein
MAIDVDSPADGANREARALTIALELQITNSPYMSVSTGRLRLHFKATIPGSWTLPIVG